MNYAYQAVLDRVVDGDTVDLWVDLGFSVWVKERFRLAYIDAPERFTEEGKAATQWIKDVLEGAELVVVSKSKDKYGRWLGEIFIEGESVNYAMVEADHAKLYL